MNTEDVMLSHQEANLEIHKRRKAEYELKELKKFANWMASVYPFHKLQYFLDNQHLLYMSPKPVDVEIVEIPIHWPSQKTREEAYEESDKGIL
jgi:hypothetical protein